ncbi:MAG: J domain-containing protein [candidate division Zixibacteria bacterium]|nr:J domain-containing protein [candidate division Zixibacteria bacterium]
MNKDYYKILGVADKATKAEVKKKFRRMAKELHPDRHPGDKAKEARFKEISEAYETLSDDKKRAEYDNMRRFGAFQSGGGGPFAGGSPFGGGGFSPGQGGPFPGQGGVHFSGDIGGAGGLSDIFESIMRSAGAAGSGRRFGRSQETPQKGPDATAELEITFQESIDGGKKRITISDPQGASKRIDIKIPQGIEDGEKIRLRGLGGSGFPGAPSGDLLVTVRVRPHQKFKRKGVDIYSEVTISLKTAALGGKVNVDTLTKKIALTIPAGTQPGAKLRLKNQGLNIDGKQGDQIVEVKVEIPTKLTPSQKKALEGF